MPDLLKSYPWRQRLKAQLGTSLIFWLFLRPSYWPWPQTGGPNRVAFEELLNRVVCAAAIILSVAVIDFLVAQYVYRRVSDAAEGRRPSADEIQARMPHPFWVGILATLLFKTFVDFVFAGRLLPAGTERLFAIERWCDVVALASLPLIYVTARRIGPPSSWWFMRSMMLEPPSNANE